MTRDERKTIDEINCFQLLFHHNYSHNVATTIVYMTVMYFQETFEQTRYVIFVYYI